MTDSPQLSISLGQHREVPALCLLLKCLKPIPRYFVDIGAGDGHTASNSEYFIAQGWSALLIDGNVEKLREARALHESNRNVHYELARLSPSGNDHYLWKESDWTIDHFEQYPNGRDDQGIFETERLSEVLNFRATGPIGILSIDIESQTLTCLAEFLAFGYQRPAVIVTEANTPNDRAAARLLFSRFGYRYQTECAVNFIYAHQSFVR